MKKVDVTKILVWAKMKNVPLEAWSKEGISALERSLGKPLRWIMLQHKYVRMGKGGQNKLEYWLNLMWIKGSKKRYVYSIGVKIIWLFRHGDGKCKKVLRSTKESVQETNNSKQNSRDDGFTEDMIHYFKTNWEEDRIKEAEDMNEKNEDALDRGNATANMCSANEISGMDSFVLN
nr:hypothetical protein [Tanacetum cinerariifolium]